MPTTCSRSHIANLFTGYSTQDPKILLLMDLGTKDITHAKPEVHEYVPRTGPSCPMSVVQQTGPAIKRLSLINADEDTISGDICFENGNFLFSDPLAACSAGSATPQPTEP